MGPNSSRVTQWALIAVLAFGFGGCAGLSHPNSSLSDVEAPLPMLASADYTLLAQQTTATKARQSDEAEMEEYDPWEPFNEKTFAFNHALDRHVIKPVAKVYDRVVPDRAQQMIGNAFDNLGFAPRFVNNLLQGKLIGAARELARLLINSTVGIGGLLDRAKTEFGIEKSKEDFGQTLGFWGFGPGPYLVLPLLPPLTVRDGVGLAFDTALDPLGYYVHLPFFWDRLGMKAGDTINDRSLNLELFQGFEETTVDLYSAVRNAYLQRRQQLIKE